MAGGVEYQVTKVDPTSPQTKGMVHQVHKVSEEIAATIGGKVYRARIINDPTAPTVAGKVYQIVLIDDPDDPSVKGMVYNAILTGGSEAVVVGPAVSPLSLPDAVAGDLDYVKAFGGTEQRNLPDGYIQRQFIYMMDGSYLLTDIVPTYDGRIEMDFQTTTLPSPSVCFLGGRTETYGGIFFVKTSAGVFMVDAFGNTVADRYTSSVSVQNNTRYKFTFNNKVAKLESGGTTLFTNTSTTENANGAALCINGLNNNGTLTASGIGIYLYSFKAWNGQGELVADYVPAIQKGTVPVVGFYDTVSKTFKTATAGTFAAGGEAVPTPDAPMDIVSNNGVLKASRNLFNASANPLEQGGITSNDGQNTATSYGQRVRTNDYVSVQPNTTYTASVKDLQIYYLEYAQDKTYTNRHASGFTNNSVTFTTGENTYFIRLQFRKSDNSDITPSGVTNVQLEQGSTATPYTPYSPTGVYTDGTVETINVHNKNLLKVTASSSTSGGVAITVNADKTITCNNTVTSSVVAFIVGRITLKPNKTYRLVGCPAGGNINTSYALDVWANSTRISSDVGTGGGALTVNSETTADIRIILRQGYACDNLTFKPMVTEDLSATYNDYVEYFDGGTATAEMLLKFGAYTDQQEIIDGTVTRNVKAIVLKGTETWTPSLTYSNVYTAGIAVGKPSGGIAPICNYYAGYSSYVSMTANDYGILVSSTATIAIKNKDCVDVTAFKTWLADQYAAGTPVIVIYPLATPTTESVAGQTLQVQDGDNTLEITQASLTGLELEAEYEKEVE